MATPPFTPELITKLKTATSWRFNSQIGPVFTPRFFCCSDPNELGIVDGKEPVAVLSLDPNPAITGDSVAFDGTDSYDPDGTITGYAWTFEDGTPATSSSGSGSVSWAAVGEYEVTLIVEDGTGLKSGPARAIMIVTDPTGTYYAATSTGVYFTIDGGQNWTAKNTGLSGDSLIVNDVKIDPSTQNLDEAIKALWAATNGGVYASNDGAANWTQKNPSSVSNVWSDSPAPTVGDLEFQNLAFSGEYLFVMATWTSGGGALRSWVFYTEDFSDIITDIDSVVTWSELSWLSGT